jgi:hypothetical protein
MAEKRNPKRKSDRTRSLDELIASGKFLKDRADKAFAEFLAIAAKFKKIQSEANDRLAEDRGSRR